ncbi:MAG: DinB family protein [Mycobacterium sp.]
MSPQTTDPTSHLADQLDWHWKHQLRPRLDGLTDDEYFWEPVAGCWTVHRSWGSPRLRGRAKRPGNDSRNGGIDFAYPPPTPTPVTTIAWRLAHVIVGVLAMRAHSHFDGPPADYATWNYAGDAATALRQLDDAYAAWMSGVRKLSAADLAKPVGPAEGGFADEPMIVLVLHINREVIHHGAEIALLRDLYVHSTHTKEI